MAVASSMGSKSCPCLHIDHARRDGNAPKVENDVKFKTFVIRLEDKLQSKEIFIICDEKVIQAKSRPKVSTA
jgi:hypothetical protein